MVIINTPLIFTGVWNLAKGWIDEKTRKKISMVGSNYYKTLAEYVSANQIPAFLGG